MKEEIEMRFGENYFMKKIFLYLLFLFFAQQSFSQKQWSVSYKLPDSVEWNKYYSSSISNVDNSPPYLVVSQPSIGVGIYASGADAQFNFLSVGLLACFDSAFFKRSLKLNTHDSSEVYFFAQRVNHNNASSFEYRVVLNGKDVITPWSTIAQFVDIYLEGIKSETGVIGGYKTTWGNFIIVEMRKKGTDKSFSATVLWRNTKPTVASIYTSKNLNEFFDILKGHRYGGYVDSISTIPLKNPVFASNESTIIFYLTQYVEYKKALEYQLIKNEKILTDWHSNEHDNNFIWLKDLGPGKYKLNLRFSKQRHNVSVYDFEIKPAWHQTTLFKIIAGGLIAAFFGFVIALYRLTRQRQKLRWTKLQKEKAELELRSVYSHLNPHFIFNSMSSIQGLINKNETESANHYLSTFSSLLRESLVNSEKDFVSLSTEIKTLETYLQLEQLRFHFQYKIEVDNNISVNDVEIPPLLMQPLVENAIKHGVSSMQEKGCIHIHFFRKENDLLILIKDNGSGFDTSLPTKGFGLKLTKERIRLLKEAGKEHTVVMSINSVKEKGTAVELQFNSWL